MSLVVYYGIGWIIGQFVGLWAGLKIVDYLEKKEQAKHG